MASSATTASAAVSAATAKAASATTTMKATSTGPAMKASAGGRPVESCAGGYAAVEPAAEGWGAPMEATMRAECSMVPERIAGLKLSCLRGAHAIEG